MRLLDWWPYFLQKAALKKPCTISEYSNNRHNTCRQYYGTDKPLLSLILDRMLYMYTSLYPGI